MYSLLTLLAGILISIMVAFNGSLAGYSGVYSAVVISYIIAIIFGIVYLLIRKESLLPKNKLPWWVFSSGAISVFSAVCSNYAFGKISMIAITALGLLAQTVTSLLIDLFGLFGFEKRKAGAATWICVAISFAGMIIMMIGTDMAVATALILSFAAGISLVLSRMLSASLAKSVSPMASTTITHMVGLPCAIIVLLLIGQNEIGSYTLSVIPAWAYLGGIFGVLVVMLTNITLKKVSALNVTLLIFIGQVFSGVVIDIIMGNEFSSRTFIGGIIVSIGVLIPTLIEKAQQKKNHA